MLKDFLQGKPLRHPLHPFLVHFPIGLFALSLLLDVASLLFNAPHLVRAAFYSLLLGITTALVAAVPGFVDYTDIPKDRPARKIATAHMILNLIAVAVFAAGAGWRSSMLDAEQTPAMPLILSLAGIGIISISGYLGGHMVFHDGVGVGRHRRRAPGPIEALRFSLKDAERLGWEATADSIRVPVASADSVRNGATIRVRIDRQDLVIVKLEGSFHAFQEYCTHRFGPLSEGSLQDEQIMCPWHRSCFDVRTGKVVKGPAKVDLKTYSVEVRNGRICVVMPRPDRQQVRQLTPEQVPEEPISGKEPRP